MKKIKLPEIKSSKVVIPEPMVESKSEWKPKTIKVGKALILPDVHVPFFCKTSLEAAINYGIEYGCQDIVLLGDFLDCYSLSTFQRDPALRDFSKEIDMCRKIIAIIDKNFKGTKVYLQGNHEQRFEKYVLEKIPEMLNIEALSFNNLIGLDSSWITVNEKRPLRIGKLTLFHGHEFQKSFGMGVNPARTLYNKTKINAVVAHSHRTSSHSECNLDGKVTTCWSLGCLSDLHPLYNPIGGYNNGFGIVDMTTDDNFTFHNHTIIKGRVY